MKVSVIIANYNGRDFIGECINSVLASSYKDFEIIVVDNGSTDGSVDFFQSLGHSELVSESKKRKILKLIQDDIVIKFILNNRNLYFTGGCNLGAKHAQGEFLFFINSDTVIDKDCLKELVNFTKNHKNYLVQPKILFFNNKTIIDNVGGNYNFLGFGFAVGRGEKDKGQYNQNRQYDYVNGTAFMINRKFFWQIGAFDERFRYFYEDIDLSLRARKAGGENWYCSKSIIYHKGSLTFKRNVSTKQQHFYLRRNRLLTLLKNKRDLCLLIRLPILIIIPILLFVQDLIQDFIQKSIKGNFLI